MPASEPAMQSSVLGPALSAPERERLAALLAEMPEGRRWAVAHMHGPLLCAIGLLGVPDSGYARAVQRRFTDPSDVRRRALALADELDRDAREERYDLRRRGRWSGLRTARSSRSVRPDLGVAAEEASPAVEDRPI
jgi:hypothetical protein